MKYIVLMDGGFVKHKFSQAFGKDPSAPDIKELSDKIILYNKEDDTLIRIYYYDSPPLTTQLKKPVSGAVLDLSKTPTFLANKQRLEVLKRTDHFAVREGRLTMNGWKLKQSAIGKATVDLTDNDFSPDIQQKVYLFTLAHGVTHELTEHSDRLILSEIHSL